MRIVGTAGHVDHGKSSLVISLTGHNPDRWVEERERGMTLDLGFAPLRFPDGVEAGIIDVPGHERFLHNMLAGAAGMDLLLLVVDAIEGPRAQTREHLHILNFLNVAQAIVVLTKSDLADADGLALAGVLAREACAGTVAEGAPVIAVSNTTGAGIAELKSAIHDALVALPACRTNAPAYLPVDRVFALTGHGTIVTGTLMQGTVRVGDGLTLQPSGTAVRVRSLQIFGRKVAAAEAGARVALNLPGIDVSSIGRGDVLVGGREFQPSTEVFVEFTPLPQARPLLRRRMPVRAHIGAAEIPGRLILDDYDVHARAMRGRIVLSRPAVTYRGCRMIVRRMSPKDLLGGAIAVDRFAADKHVAAADWQDDRPGDDACLQAIEGASLSPINALRVAAAANVREADALAAIDRLLSAGSIVAIAKPVEYISRTALDAAFERVESALRERHARAPWRLGCSTSEIAAAIGCSDALAVRLLAALHDDGRVGAPARYWHLPDFTPSPSKEQRGFFDKALASDVRSPLLPASYDAIATAADKEKIAGVREALESLLATGALVRIGDDVYRRSQIDHARSLLVEILRNNPAGATMATLRDAFGTSRKYALPLLEHFDSIGLTIRDGDLRRLRAPAGKAGAQVQI
jgi:selenocysteine-specific elongation factor